MMLVRAVLNSPDRSISLMQSVDSFYDVTVADLVLELVVTSVGVLYFVLVLVLRIRL